MQALLIEFVPIYVALPVIALVAAIYARLRDELAANAFLLLYLGLIFFGAIYLNHMGRYFIPRGVYVIMFGILVFTILPACGLWLLLSRLDEAALKSKREA